MQENGQPMTKQRIAQYGRLRREIAMIEDKLFDPDSPGDEMVSDLVRTSIDKRGWKVGHVAIAGYGSRAFPRLRERMVAKTIECEAIENYINSVEDSIMWQLLTIRYIEGKSLKETAEQVGYTTGYASKLINDFLKRT